MNLQIALFVAPVLVFVSLFMGNPLTLEFNNFELIALTASAAIAAFISVDGRSNWLEGAMLLAVYLILGLAFFFFAESGLKYAQISQRIGTTNEELGTGAASQRSLFALMVSR